MTDNALTIFNLNNDLLLLQFHCNDNCDVGSNKNNTMEILYV